MFFLLFVVAVFVVSPRPIAVQIGQKMVAGALELLPVQPQTHQPDTERKQLIITLCFLHYRASLGNCLCRNRKTKIDISRSSSGMKGTYIKVLNDVVFDELKNIKTAK